MCIRDRRYGIHQLSACGEKLSSNFEEMEAFKKIFHEFIETESLTGDQIFNCDESGLNYKMLPSKSLAARTEAVSYTHLDVYKRQRMQRVWVINKNDSFSQNRYMQKQYQAFYLHF